MTQFDNATMDAIQEDEELASCYSAYQDARKRLQERFRHRGFWPTSKGGKGKGSKGKGKSFQRQGKGQSLQNRILNSTCRLCGEKGHWKAECPRRSAMYGKETTTPASSFSSMPTAHVTTKEEDPPGLTMEFYGLKELPETTLDATRQVEQCFVSCWGQNNHTKRALDILSNRMNGSHDRAGVKTLSVKGDTEVQCARIENESRQTAPIKPLNASDSRQALEIGAPSDAPFATHGTFGVVDLGATKTVIGSHLVQDLLNTLTPEIRAQVARCSCQVTFRFEW